MNLSFLEYIPFIKFRDENLTDEQYQNLQNELLEDPEKGDVIQGTGGLRKMLKTIYQMSNEKTLRN